MVKAWVYTNECQLKMGTFGYLNVKGESKQNLCMLMNEWIQDGSCGAEYSCPAYTYICTLIAQSDIV